MDARTLRTGALLLAIGALALGSAAASGLRVNLTDSYPLGVWRLETGSDYQRGAMVIACPPERVAALAKHRGYLTNGACPGGVPPLLKRVVAVAGDRVSVGLQGVSVNGEPIANSRPLVADAGGRQMPAVEGGEVAPGTVWLMSDSNPKSFDSRYFGAVEASRIKGVATPLLVWDDAAEAL